VVRNLRKKRGLQLGQCIIPFLEGSLEVKLPRIWADEAAEVGREEKKKEDQRRERVRKKKMKVREKVEKWRNTVFFQ